MKDEVLDVIVPFSLVGRDCKSAEDLATSITELREKYGFKRFALSFPGKSWRQVGFPPEEFYRQHAELFNRVRALLNDPEISCGWWITLTVRSGPTPGVGRIHKSDGTVSPDTACPLNGEFRKIFTERAALVCAVAHPDFVLIEDDFAIGAATEYLGCFCDDHLAEFARRAGRFYSKEELFARFKPLTDGALYNRNNVDVKDLKKRLEDSSSEDLELFRIWWELKRDSLAGALAYLRKELDKLTPEIPVGICQPGLNMIEGNNTYYTAAAAAGKNHVPFVRIHGTFYGGQDIDRVPTRLFDALYCKQSIKGKFRFYHESDTYPHTRFFSSATVMKTLMGTAFSYGFDGSLFQVSQLLDAPNEENAYGSMYCRERKRFNAVSLRAKECSVKGVQLVYEPFLTMTEENGYAAWCKALAHFGIPYTTHEADTVFISGRQMLRWSDEQILEVMKKQLFLDGEAAYVLAMRGFGHLIGVDVKCAEWVMDLDSREVISEKFAEPGKGECMARSDYFAPKGRGRSFVLEIKESSCEAVTRIFTYDEKFLGCGMTRFKNQLGGTVIVCSQGVDGNASSSFFNYRRKRLLLKLLLMEDRSNVLVHETAKVFTVMNEAIDSNAPFAGMITLINLAPDPWENAELYLPEKWRNCSRFTLLDANGDWVDCPCRRTVDGIGLEFPLNYGDPVYISAVK